MRIPVCSLTLVLIASWTPQHSQAQPSSATLFYEDLAAAVESMQGQVWLYPNEGQWQTTSRGTVLNRPGFAGDSKL